jgi:hypothetical protein
MKGELPFRASYPVTPSIVDWLSSNFEAFERGAWEHYHGCKNLFRAVRAAEESGSHVASMIADEKIREYNEQNNTSVTRDEIQSGSVDYVMEDIGGWMAFTDDSRALLEDDHASAEVSLYCADDSVRWVIVWCGESHLIYVYRSPVLGDRVITDEESLIAEGFSKGDQETFVLPPQIEAAIWQDIQDSLREEA